MGLLIDGVGRLRGCGIAEYCCCCGGKSENRRAGCRFGDEAASMFVLVAEPNLASSFCKGLITLDDKRGCGDGHVDEPAVCGEVRSFPRWPSGLSGMRSRSPLSLGVREPLIVVFGGVLTLGGVNGLSGAGLGIRGEASGVLSNIERANEVEVVE